MKIHKTLLFIFKILKLKIVKIIMKKYYKILGLEEGASVQDIQDTYDKLLVELDPKNNDERFLKKNILVQEAYDKLMGYFNDTADDDFSEKKMLKIIMLIGHNNNNKF